MARVKFPNAHNVFKVFDPEDEGNSRNQPENLVVHPFMQALITKLLERRPTWGFVANGYGTPEGEAYVHSEFAIESNGERLGTIGMRREWRSGETKYEYDCERLRAKRQKSTTPHTKDLNKAVKAIIDNMYNRTPGERANIARQQTGGVVSRASSGADYNYRRHVGVLVEHLVSFAADNWDKFAAVPMEPNAVKARDVLLDTKQKLADVMTVSDALTQQKGVILIEAGSRYILSTPNSNDAIRLCRLDELSDRLKSSLGILKLLPEKQLAPGIGARVGEETFYVVDANE